MYEIHFFSSQFFNTREINILYSFKISIRHKHIFHNFIHLNPFLYFQLNITQRFQVLYRDDVDDKGIELKIDGCGSKCSLDEFKKALEAVTPNDWEAECELVK